MAYWDVASELASDGFQKARQSFTIPTVFVPCFKESEVTEENGVYRLKLSLIICKAYFYSVKELTLEGRRYFLAEKCIITGEKEHPYVREIPTFFYRENGAEETDPAIKLRLHQKIQFLNII